jgi:outer membrane protein assembly factor BamB
MSSRILAIVLTTSLSTSGLAAAAGESEPDTWPQFRGPGGLAIATDAGVPHTFSASENVVWKTAIEGLGHSSPIVWGHRVFLTTAIEGDVVPGAAAPTHTFSGEEFKHPDAVGADRAHTFKVIAVDAQTGRVLWSQVAFEGRVYDDRHKASSYASPTPVTDGQRVYAYFGSEGIFAYDLDGKLVWSRDIGDIKSVGLGIGTSPVLFGDALIVQADEDSGDQSFIIALDRRTGEPLWRKPRAVQASWSTPLVVTGEQPQLVTSGNELIISYDPRNGEELWRARGLDSNAIHVPLLVSRPDGDLVIVSAGYPQKVVKAFRLDQRGDSTAKDDAAVWTYAKGTAYVPTNLLYAGHLYLLNDSGILTCLDAATGDVLYEGGRPPEGGRYTASPIVVDGQILLVNGDGDAHFVRAGPVFEVLSTGTIDERVYATPAVAGGRLFLRGERHLFAIDDAS